MQFKTITGQRVLINRLTEIIDKGRVSHAQMFLGDMGYGTLALALAYAQYLSCENRQHYDNPAEHDGLRADSCGHCPNCQKYQQLMHPDLHLYFPTTTNSHIKTDPDCSKFINQFQHFLLDTDAYAYLNDWYLASGAENKQGNYREADIHELNKNFTLTTYEHGYKIYIFWYPELMSVKIANELLKNLEEPYDNTLILFAAENDARILETIKSRLQTIRVGKILDANLSEEAEGNAIKQKLLDKGESDKALLGQMFVSWMRLLFKLNMESLSSWVDQAAAMTREQQKLFLRYSMDQIDRSLRHTATAGAMQADLATGDERFDQMFPAMVTVNNAGAINDAINDAIQAISLNCYSKVVLMNLSFKLSILIKNRNKKQ